MPCTEKAYLIPVIIIEVTFVNPFAVNGGVDGAPATPEQLTFIVFMALTDEELIANAENPDKGLKRVLGLSKPLMLVYTALEIVKFFKLKVYAAKFVKPVPTTEVVLNDGIDSKEAQDSNI